MPARSFDVWLDYRAKAAASANIHQVMDEKNSSMLTRCDAYHHLALCAPLRQRREG
jgi:hypothetical protein